MEERLVSSSRPPGEGRIDRNCRTSASQQALRSAFHHTCPGNATYHTGFHSRRSNRLLHSKDKAATGQLREAGRVTPSYQAIFRTPAFPSCETASQWGLNDQRFSDSSQGRNPAQEAAPTQQWLLKIQTLRGFIPNVCELGQPWEPSWAFGILKQSL